MAMHVKNLDSSWGGVRRQLGRSSLCRLELKATRYQLFPGRRATWCDGLEASTPPYDGGIFESARGKTVDSSSGQRWRQGVPFDLRKTLTLRRAAAHG
jgi:hypothetical protein